MARVVLTCMDALMPRAHGCGEAAYNPFAFPPSLEVRCGKCREAQATDRDVGS